MAYSRWGLSKWYVYGCTPVELPLEETQLMVCPNNGRSYRFYYFQLKNDIESCINKIKNEVEVTVEEIIELREIIKIYIEETETDEDKKRKS